MVAEARNELEFYGIQLAPHHVEVLFVLSALLGGRRKKEFKALMLVPREEEGRGSAEGGMGLIEALGVMWERMSWGKASHHYHTLGAMAMTMTMGEDEEEEGLYAGGGEGQGQEEEEEGEEEDGEEGEEEEEEEGMPPAQAHLHGPHCECTTDSALRVQFLRTLQNALEPDWEEDDDEVEEDEEWGRGRKGGVRRLMVSDEEWASMRALSAGGGGGEGAAAAAAGSGSTGSSRSTSSSSSSGSLLSKLVKVRRSGMERGNGRRKGRREEGLHRNSMEGTCSEESKHVWHLYPPSLPSSLVPPLSFLDAHVRERGQSLPVLDLFLPRGLPPRLPLLRRRSSTRRC